MNKLRSGIFLFLTMVSLAVCLASCGGNGEKEKEHEGREVTLYYLNVDEDDYVAVDYRLSQKDNPEKESQEIIGLLSSKDEADSSDCKVPIPEEVAVNSIQVKDGKEVIDFGAGYQQMDPVQESLMRLAVVRSVCQVKGVDSITFTVNGEPILDLNGKAIKNMTEDKVLLSEEFDRIYEQEGEVTLYYSDTKGSKLIPWKEKIKAENNEPLLEAVLKALKKAPKGEKSMISPLPEGVVVNQAQIVGSICYVDLSNEISNLVPEVEEEVTIYAMVNTIASLDKNYRVQFTVEGERVASINGYNGFDLPLAFNPDLVHENKQKQEQ